MPTQTEPYAALGRRLPRVAGPVTTAFRIIWIIPIAIVVTWLLVIPHVIVLAFLIIGAFIAVVVAWFAIVATGRYPRGLFDYVVGVGR
jgi:hypothetical protein